MPCDVRRILVPPDHAIEIAPARGGERVALRIQVGDSTAAVMVGPTGNLPFSERSEAIGAAFLFVGAPGRPIAKIPFAQEQVFARAFGKRDVVAVVAEELDATADARA